ncbi:MAG: VCBS repeat-containing protein [Planctomycetota bacterium]|nr:VCBS repeat-containing protein [Planctomycetota bacterium]MDA1105782.1 VCBS repeat-containing protein [Planctomycetota bacterium]
MTRSGRPILSLRAPLQLLAGTWLALSVALPSWADDALAPHYGFEGLEVIKIDSNAGPLEVADMNGDGLSDVIVANDRRSRIEVHLQKRDASPADEVAPSKVNEFPEHWRYRRVEVPVSEAVAAIVPFDFDGDGRMDLIHIGHPEKIVFTRQSAPGVFEVAQRHKVKKLLPGRGALAVADVTGDATPEVLAIADGRIQVFPMDGAKLGAPTELSAGGPAIVAMELEDFNGDGLVDVLGLVPDDAAPVRAWFGSREGEGKVLGPQSRFEMPALHDASVVRVPGRDAALLACIERPSKRMILYSVGEATVAPGGEADGSMRTWAFTDPSNRKRQLAIADINGDGLPEVLATNTERNAVSIFPQRPGVGLGAALDAPSYADLDSLAVADLDGDGKAEVLVASEKEGVAGVARTDAAGHLGFPESLPLAKGRVPSTLGVVTIRGEPWVAVVTKDGRNYSLELLPAKDPSAGRTSVDLGSLSRAPSTILSIDADQDGRKDILLFTPEKPMMMVRQVTEGDAAEAADGAGQAAAAETAPTFALVESKDMAQFGLAQAAGADNSVALDLDGDGKEELVIADRNYLRALRYNPTSGWTVVTQVNAPRGDAKLVALDRIGSRLAALDKENSAILLFDRGPDGAWSTTESLPTGDGTFLSMRAGQLSGADGDALLLVGSDAFGVMAFGGSRPKLDTVASWRSDSTARVPHELISGDINADGFTDLVALDAAEQMADIIAVTEALNLRHAMGFELYETKMFSAGDRREFEPSQGVIADVTGDGAPDLVLMCHDRVLIYPQMVKPD